MSAVLTGPRTVLPCRSGHGSFTSGAPWRRTKRAAGWGTPAWVLALVPKCPMCVAAYLALATGLEISMVTAEWLRLAVIGVCAVVLGLLMVKAVRGLAVRR